MNKYSNDYACLECEVEAGASWQVVRFANSARKVRYVNRDWESKSISSVRFSDDPNDWIATAYHNPEFDHDAIWVVRRYDGRSRLATDRETMLLSVEHFGYLPSWARSA
jgi:hypothetical protein